MGLHPSAAQRQASRSRSQTRTAVPWVSSSRSSEVRDFRGRLHLCVFFPHNLTLSLPSESTVDATTGFQMSG